MESNSAKKAPVLDRLVDIGKSPKKAVQQTQNSTHNPKPTSLTPNNRRIDKSEFELRLGDIVNKIISKHINNASDEIVEEVLREVRARLPGKRRD